MLLERWNGGKQEKTGTVKMHIDNEPFWLNMEACKAARVLIKEVSAFYHQEDVEVTHWRHAFVYHPSEITLPGMLQEKFPPNPTGGRWVRLSALVEHLHPAKQEGPKDLLIHTRGLVRMVPKEHWAFWQQS